jgi:hypothetical protein
MNRFRRQRDQMIPRLFALNDEAVEYRNQIRNYARIVIWAILSGLSLVLFFFFAENTIQRLTVVGLSLVVYLPVFGVAYTLARKKAANYLADIYELEDESVADSFLEEVIFGDGSDKITIHEGKISEKDEESPIILIGGPGYIQVNLDSVALLERVDGTPEIIHPRGKPWKLGSFERIREIGKSDEPGKREYAIINLRDQFVRGLSVRSRTKDGIPFEAQDIKIMFSILRKPKDEAPENDPYHFDENAVYSLVYNQTIITPPPAKPAGVSFPWDTTVIPLITNELENLITSRNLSEILASISHKEIDALNAGEATNKQIRIEMTGEHTVPNSAGSFSTPNFESRSKITSQFFSPEFKAKAAKLGVTIHWIDIGNWQLPSAMILEELKNAWQMMRENARRRNDIERLAKRHEMKELLDLVNNVIVSSYTKSSNSAGNRKLSDKEFSQLAKIIEENPNIAFSPTLQQRFAQDAASKKETNSAALEILKAFRREFIVARELIQKENRSSIEKQADITKIDKALREIDYHVFHYIKG